MTTVDVPLCLDHWLKPIKVTSTPRNVIFLDCEAHQVRKGRVETQTFRLAAATYQGTRAGRADYTRVESATFDTPAELWTWVTARGPSRGKTYVIAHKLDYDLRIADAFTHLPALGFKLRGKSLEWSSTWFDWYRDTRTIVMIDSLSWLPTALENLGHMVGIDKPPLPRPSASKAVWLNRCEADVAILREAWNRAMAWVEAEDLGSFRMSAAGQAWSAYRKRFYTDKVLVHGHRDVRAAERQASWTGRTEAWRHGVVTGGPFHEWDLERCYATIARDCELPTVLHGFGAGLTAKARARLAQSFAVLCQVTVTTDVPIVPARRGDAIVWPVGTFQTTLWDTEVRLAEENGAEVTVHRHWTYRRTPLLAAFCGWVIEQLDRPAPEVDPVVRLVLKHWSRSLIGRFAAQYKSWEDFGDCPDSRVALSNFVHVEKGPIGWLLQLGHQTWQATEKVDSTESAPQVTSWVMAEARARLWPIMQAAGLDHVVQVDTDGLIVDHRGHQALVNARVPGLRVKARHLSLEILGPRQLITDNHLRAAGIPRRATRTGPATWEGEVWTSLKHGLRTGETDRVTITDRTFAPRGTDNRRRRLPDGRTEPWELP